METAEFKSKVMSDMHVKLREHSFKVRTHYREVKRLKENRPSELKITGAQLPMMQYKARIGTRKESPYTLVSSITKMRML